MRKLRPRPFFVVLASLFMLKAAAQQLPRDSTPDLTYAISQYNQFLFPEKNLYTGRQYLDYRNVLYEGHHPFFRWPDFQQATIMYDGMLYEDQPAQFDIFRNVLVTWDPGRRYLIQLLNEKLDWFTINGIRFIHLRPSGNRTVVEDGFYRSLYDGRTKVLKLEQKRVVQEIDIKKVLRKIEETPRYFVLADNVYYEITGRSSLLKAFKNKNSEISQFIRKNNLDIQDDKDNALAAVAAQYDQLNR